MGLLEALLDDLETDEGGCHRITSNIMPWREDGLAYEERPR